MAHCQKRDPLRKFFINFFTDFFFFLPISRFFKNYIVSIQERKADNKASLFVHPLHLANALIKVAKSNRRVYSTIFSFKDGYNLEKRIKELIYGRKISFKFPFKKLVLSLTILILIFNVFLIPQFYIKASNCECSEISIWKSHFYNCCEMRGIKFGGKN
jgi:beta-lactamase regulating signal transducer with metallopeptidase domain